MLKLTERKATLGPTAGLRTEYHGDDVKIAVTFDVLGVTVDESELGALLGCGEAFDALYRKTQDGPEPKFRDIKPLMLKDKVEGLRLELWFGQQREPLVLAPVDVKAIEVACVDGGPPVIGFRVLATDPGTALVTGLYRHLNFAVRIACQPMQTDLVDEAAAAEPDDHDEREGAAASAEAV